MITSLYVAYVAASFLALTTAASAQNPVGASNASPPPAETPRLYTLNVKPAAAVTPPLRYILLPDLLEQSPGNALPLYYTALDLIDSAEGKEVDKFRDSVSGLLEKPFKDMPLKEAREIVDRHKSAFEQIDLAARREVCDWNLPIRTQGITMPLPSLARFRTLARLVALRARVQIADGRLEDALRTIETGLAMARHAAEAPTLINALVAVAMADITLQRAQELVQQPGAPNLYWALTDLPRPFIDVRNAMQFEKGILFVSMPKLRNLADTDMTPQQWEELADEIPKILNGGGMPPAGSATNWENRLGIAAVAVKIYPLAKKQLVASGLSAERVKAMPVQKVVMLYLLDRYINSRDEMFKWFSVPYWQAAEGLRAAEKNIEQTRGNELNPFVCLLPSLSRAYFQTTKLDRTIAAMRCVEALRMHAAANEGRLPASLDEIKLVPVPIDPTTGASFKYEAGADRAAIESPAPTGFSLKDAIRYEVTVTK